MYTTFLIEKFQNLFKSEDKEKYKDQVWEKLQKAYEDIGGIKGSGFASKEDMINKIPFWKISVKNDNIVAGILYKDKGYRKAVVAFTDGSSEGKNKLKEILKAEFSRSNIEISHKLLKFYEKTFPELLKKYSVSTKDVEKILDDEIEIIDDIYYYREINGEKIKKRMVGALKELH